ncbi:MAG: hypothetical protein P9F75_03135 [Candidatus Contendobacter sp.]|nr:hypothetical protein [Candidatus Contendobacter sp.]MDS4031457.1 hypothetical protein [Candidatus Contendobacter sp.]MDS4060187.1 hypothetical protein [Candidatus Contendobacter sp.]
MSPVDNPTHDPRPTAHGAIFARVGDGFHRLALRIPSGNGKPALVNATGAKLNPWDVELLYWPSEAETPLRRGGYLPLQPVDLELWCNCAD